MLIQKEPTIQLFGENSMLWLSSYWGKDWCSSHTSTLGLKASAGPPGDPSCVPCTYGGPEDYAWPTERQQKWPANKNRGLFQKKPDASKFVRSGDAWMLPMGQMWTRDGQLEVISTTSQEDESSSGNLCKVNCHRSGGWGENCRKK